MTMKKRYALRNTANEQYYSGQEEALPTHLPVAVYYRQSSDRQIGNQSTFMQQEDLPKMLQAKGWAENNIILIDDDAGISGTKTFNDRKGARRLMQLIADKKIGAVCVIDVSRLTRDEWGIDANVYIKLCAGAEVVTVTPTWTYVFHSRSSSFHIRQFRHQAEYAAEHITFHLRERLIPAKQRKHRAGDYIGGSRVPIGYCIDQKDRFVPFPPYADYVRMYFQLILDNHGNLSAALRTMHENGMYIPRYDAPDVLKELPPGCKLMISKQNEDHTKRRIMHWSELGYMPTREVLTRMATNVVYIGWWVVKGEIVSKENHPPVVDPELFWSVYNLINPYSVTGGANPNFNPHGHRIHKRYSKEGRSERPLLHGLIYHDTETGLRMRAVTIWDQALKLYAFDVRGREHTDDPPYVWQKQARIIEEPVIAMLKERIDTVKAEEIIEADASYRKRRDGELSLLRVRYREIEKAIETAIGNLAFITDHTLIPSVQKIIQGLKGEQASVATQISELEADSDVIDQLVTLKRDLIEFGERWDELSYAQRSKAVKLLIDHIVTRISGNDIEVEVIWADMYHHEGTTYVDASKFRLNARRGTNGWRDDELATLYSMVRAGNTRKEIMKALPNRSWKAIQNKFYFREGYWFHAGEPDNRVSEFSSDRYPTICSGRSRRPA